MEQTRDPAADGVTDADATTTELRRALEMVHYRIRSWGLALDRNLLALLTRLDEVRGALAADPTAAAAFDAVLRHASRACRLAAFDRTLGVRPPELRPVPVPGAFARLDDDTLAALREALCALGTLAAELRVEAEHQEWVDALNNARAFGMAVYQLEHAASCLAVGLGDG